MHRAKFNLINKLLYLLYGYIKVDLLHIFRLLKYFILFIVCSIYINKEIEIIEDLKSNNLINLNFLSKYFNLFLFSASIYSILNLVNHFYLIIYLKLCY